MKVEVFKTTTPGETVKMYTPENDADREWLRRKRTEAGIPADSDDGDWLRPGVEYDDAPAKKRERRR